MRVFTVTLHPFSLNTQRQSMSGQYLPGTSSTVLSPASAHFLPVNANLHPYKALSSSTGLQFGAVSSGNVVAAFQDRWGKPMSKTSAPGRGCVFSAHTDYNGGNVLAFALGKGIYCVGRKDPSDLVAPDQRQFTVINLNRFKPERAFFNLNEVESALEKDPKTGRYVFKPGHQPDPGHPTSWVDYLKYMAALVDLDLKEQGRPGLETGQYQMMVGGDLESNAGISSSAALLISTALNYRKLAEDPIDKPVSESVPERIHLAKLAQNAEHLTGANVGLLDHLASILGMDNTLLAINCESSHPEVTFVPMPSLAEKGKVLFRVNVGVVHNNSGGESEYNKRVKQCNTALDFLKNHLPPNHTKPDRLALYTEQDVEGLKDQFDAVGYETEFRRALHVTGENRRTREGTEALAAGDFQRAAQLMNESHQSQRDNYEISCKELEFVRKKLLASKGVDGVQLIGGGHGGNLVVLGDRSALSQNKASIIRAYAKAFPNYGLTFEEMAPSQGAGSF